MNKRQAQKISPDTRWVNDTDLIPEGSRIAHLFVHANDKHTFRARRDMRNVFAGVAKRLGKDIHLKGNIRRVYTGKGWLQLGPSDRRIMYYLDDVSRDHGKHVGNFRGKCRIENVLILIHNLNCIHDDLHKSFDELKELAKGVKFEPFVVDVDWGKPWNTREVDNISTLHVPTSSEVVSKDLKIWAVKTRNTVPFDIIGETK